MKESERLLRDGWRNGDVFWKCTEHAPDSDIFIDEILSQKILAAKAREAKQGA